MRSYTPTTTSAFDVAKEYVPLLVICQSASSMMGAH